MPLSMSDLVPEPQDSAKLLKMVEECEGSDDLSSWECQFLDGMSFKLGNNETLTQKEVFKLEEIHTRVA